MMNLNSGVKNKARAEYISMAKITSEASLICARVYSKTNEKELKDLASWFQQDSRKWLTKGLEY